MSSGFGTGSVSRQSLPINHQDDACMVVNAAFSLYALEKDASHRLLRGNTVMQGVTLQRPIARMFNRITTLSSLTWKHICAPYQ
eukprot:scaffold114779_cov31-Prasinocladus_malaysianus.AAC.1